MAIQTAGDDPWIDKTRPQPSEWAEFLYFWEIASDPNAPAAELEAAAAAVMSGYQGTFSGNECIRVLEAVAANPNTSPNSLAQVLDWSQDALVARAFCRNPFAPFLLLEQPDFFFHLDERTQRAIVREADAPVSIVQALAVGAAHSEMVRDAALLHVAYARNTAAPNAWEAKLSSYWRRECTPLKNKKEGQWHSDFAEIGLAPAWAIGAPPVPKRSRQTSSESRAVLDVWFNYAFAPGSSKEKRLLKRIGPKMENQAALAYGLRKEATANDLRELFFTRDDPYGLVWQAILRHPSADARLLEAMTRCDDAARYAIAQHPRASATALAVLLESDEPPLRRLARRHPNAPENALDLSRRAVCRYAFRHFSLYAGAAPTPFLVFLECLHCGLTQEKLIESAESSLWTRRLNAAVCAPVTNEPMAGEPFARTGRDLLTHLVLDGNYFVHGMAQARLANPNYVFTW